MTQQKQNGKLIAIITMIFLFGMISFVTNLAAPMGIVLKNQFSVSNALGMLGNFGNFIAYAVMGIPSGILLQRVGYKKTALIAVAVGFIGVGIQYLSGHSSPDMAFAVYLIGAFIAGFSMCLLNTVVIFFRTGFRCDLCRVFRDLSWKCPAGCVCVYPGSSFCVVSGDGRQ